MLLVSLKIKKETMHRTHTDLIQSLVRQNVIKNERIKTVMLATDRLDFSTDRLYEDAPQPSNIIYYL